MREIPTVTGHAIWACCVAPMVQLIDLPDLSIFEVAINRYNPEHKNKSFRAPGAQTIRGSQCGSKQNFFDRKDLFNSYVDLCIGVGGENCLFSVGP